MKSLSSRVKEKMITRYLDKNPISVQSKSTDINVLLNRVRLDQKRTLKKRIAFSVILACLVSSLAIYFVI